MQRMTASQALEREPAALERAKAPDRLHRISRTARMEAATLAEQRADPAFVAAKQGDEQAVDHVSLMPASVVTGAGTRCRKPRCSRYFTPRSAGCRCGCRRCRSRV